MISVPLSAFIACGPWIVVKKAWREISAVEGCETGADSVVGSFPFPMPESFALPAGKPIVTACIRRPQEQSRRWAGDAGGVLETNLRVSCRITSAPVSCIPRRRRPGGQAASWGGCRYSMSAVLCAVLGTTSHRLASLTTFVVS